MKLLTEEIPSAMGVALRNKYKNVTNIYFY
jgi:hypothetical protein